MEADRWGDFVKLRAAARQDRDDMAVLMGRLAEGTKELLAMIGSSGVEERAFRLDVVDLDEAEHDFFPEQEFFSVLAGRVWLWQLRGECAGCLRLPLFWRCRC